MPVITCPECDKQMRVGPEHNGKKIRCKGCGEVFAVRLPKEELAANKPKDEKKPAAAAIPVAKQNEEEDGSAYGVETVNLAARCPHCTQLMESEEAIICLNCGYNMRTRSRRETKAVYEPSTEDYIYWLGPGVACLIGAIILLVLDLICYNNMNSWLKDSPLDNGDGTWIVKPNMFSLYIFLFSLAICVPLLKFAYRRLILNSRPPEVEIKSK